MKMTTKLGRVTYNEELPSKKSQDPLIMYFARVTWQIKFVISTNTKPMAIKLGKVVS